MHVATGEQPDDEDSLAAHEKVEASAWTLRGVLEASQSCMLSGATLTPRIEGTLRLDGGDAETGAGADSGRRVNITGRQLALNVSGHLLAQHTNDAYPLAQGARVGSGVRRGKT